MDIKALNKDLAEIILGLSSILGKPISEDKFAKQVQKVMLGFIVNITILNQLEVH